MSIRVQGIDCITWDATYVSIEAFANEYYPKDDYDKNTTFIHAFNGTLPSDKPEDYMDIYCSFEVINRSLFDQVYVDALISKLGEHAGNVLWSDSAGSGFGTYLHRLSKDSITFRLAIYIGDMTDDNIKEMVQTMKASALCEGKYLGTREKEIGFKNSKDKITIERAK
ncbi:hypothetical protein LQZ18_15030 [Lachnospiraceae bacterium ZAX-1]